MLWLDHIALAAETLEEGCALIAERLDLPLSPIGRHDRMGTHNRLIGMGDLYFELIATDPAAPAPPTPRWFGLDGFSGRPRLSNWICRCDDLAAELAQSPEGTGRILDFARGDFRWQMAVPASGLLPFDNLHPALMQWQTAAHPAERLPDCGLRLLRLEISHPEAAALQASLGERLQDGRLAFHTGPAALRAEFDTPKGKRVLE